MPVAAVTGVPATGAPAGDGAPGARREAERDLFRRYRMRGDVRARDALIESFLPLARQLARRYRRSAESLEDLEQVASLGLVKAVDRFDLSRGTAFTSFMVPTVLGELKRYLRDSSWAAHVPRRMQERVMRVTGAIDQLASERGRAPSVAEVAAGTDQSSEEVLEAMEAARAYNARPLEMPPTGDEEDADHLAALGRSDPGYELAELGASVRPAMKALPLREREILRLRLIEDLTQSQIAARVGISQMHVSRLIRGALAVMRRAADEDAVADRAI